MNQNNESKQLMCISTFTSCDLLQRLHGHTLTRETHTLHLASVVPAQRGVELLEVGVPAGDDGRSLVAAAGLDHVDGVELR